jgi:hypothetical protein
VKYAGPITVRIYRDDVCLGARTASKWGGWSHFGVSEPGAYTVAWKLPGRSEITYKLAVTKVHEFTIGAEPGK